jgi:hypothetical protein
MKSDLPKVLHEAAGAPLLAHVGAAARESGVPAEERTIRLAELKEADEGFLTATSAEVLPIGTVDGRPFPAGHPWNPDIRGSEENPRSPASSQAKLEYWTKHSFPFSRRSSVGSRDS